MTARAGSALRVALLVLGLVAGFALERSQHGLERGALAAAVIACGLLARDGLAVLARTGDATPRLLAAVVLGSLAGFHRYPLARWSLAVLAGAALGVGLPRLRAPADDRPASRTEELLPASFLALALAVLVVNGAARSWTSGVALVVLALEALGPGAHRSAADAARRTASFALLAGALLLAGQDRSAVQPLDLERVLLDGEELLREDVLALARLPLIAVGLVELLLRRRRDTAAERATRRRRALARTLALLLPLLLAWGVLELAFRIVPGPHRDLTLHGSAAGSTWHVPGGRYVYEGPMLGPREVPGVSGNAFTWNAEGFHDRDHALVRPRGVARVLVLGDSYVEGVQHPVDALYHVRLEEHLRTARPGRPVEALAYSTSGWGQIQELDALRERGLAHGPQLVVLEFLPLNDVRNNLEALEVAVNAPLHARWLERRGVELGLWFTAFVGRRLAVVERRLRGTPASLDVEVFLRDPPAARAALWREAWDRTEELVAAIQDECRRSGATLVVVVFTMPGDYRAKVAAIPGADPAYPARRMAELCARRSIPFLDLEERLMEKPGSEALHLEHDKHWTRAGHDAAAWETARFLLDETDVWDRALDRAR